MSELTYPMGQSEADLEREANLADVEAGIKRAAEHHAEMMAFSRIVEACATLTPASRKRVAVMLTELVAFYSVAMEENKDDPI